MVPVCVPFPIPSAKLFAPSVIEATLIGPLPLRKVALSAKVVAPKSIAVLVVSTVPAMLVELAAVVSNPPKKELVPMTWPMVTLPVLRKLVSPAMEFEKPVMETL